MTNGDHRSMQVTLPTDVDEMAPDGSEVRLLVRAGGGSMAHFRLAPGDVAIAHRHRTVTELWYVLAGTGRMWRETAAGEESEIALERGVALAIPVGSKFQFRNDGDSALEVVAVTIPPWPGDGEAEAVDGPWWPTVERP